MARRSKGGIVFAYETDPRELDYCREMARINGVDGKMRFLSWCDGQEIARNCTGRRCFVLSDCEGYEHDLFGPTAVQALRLSDLVIELHDRPGINMAETLQSRFAVTHTLSLLSVEPRIVENYPEATVLGAAAQRALSDHRLPHQQWLHCVAKRD